MVTCARPMDSRPRVEEHVVKRWLGMCPDSTNTDWPFQCHKPLHYVRPKESKAGLPLYLSLQFVASS